ncbi:trehalose-phosphatase [Arthrobacter sp. 35W]|uniref:trehalose-phosphatase n=1 Tax=Arthrobacter sp. 35W TaxID=1132441 RepID=UPI0004052314|nr:trehalose-phosphatase [Arthrobacter sp. 35W]
MASDGAVAIPADLQHAIAALAQTERLLVALDFDGTMSPLVPRPEDARPLPASATAFAALSALPGTTTALISGRALASLRLVAGPPAATLLVGSHGAEVWLGPGAAPLELSDAEQDALSRVVAALEAVAAEHPGTAVEYKPAGAVLHTRQADDAVGDSAIAAARSALTAGSGIHLTDGKRVLEAAVVRADKGQGLGLLRDAAAATAVFFAGDDVTDEHAFAALGTGDVGVKVGPGETAAGYRIPSPAGLPAVLEQLLAGRERWSRTQQ